MSESCPTCGRRAPKFDPHGRVVTGAAIESEAPVLWRAWRVVRQALALLPPGVWVPRTRVLDAVTVLDPEVNRSTAEQLLRAAESVGMLEAEHRRGGDPLRWRVYLRGW